MTQPKGALQYVFDAINNRWVAWKGTGAGFAGVTLESAAGSPIDVTDGTSDNVAPLTILDTASLGYLLQGSTWDRARSLPSDTDAQVAAQDGLAGVVNRSYGFNGTTWDRSRSFNGSADALTPPTLGLVGTRAFLNGYNGATWDLLRSLGNNLDGSGAQATGVLLVNATVRGFNGTTFDRILSFAGNADNLTAPTLGLLGSAGFNLLFDGTTWDRARSASAANISATTQAPALVAAPGNWTLTSAPAVNTVATATRAAGAAGVRHVLTSICADLNCVSAVTVPLVLVVRDGATGAGTILWQRRLTGTAGTTTKIEMTGLNIVGTAATAMTVEFTAAPALTDFETVSATGYSVA